MFNEIFTRWDIGNLNERISYFDCANGIKIIRALRWFLPKVEYMKITTIESVMILRLSQVAYNPSIRVALEKMQSDIYGGYSHRIHIPRLRQAIE